MITLFIIGIVILIIKLVFFACKLTLGVVKGILFVIGAPIILIVLFAIGLTYLAFPILIVAIIVSFVLSLAKRI